MCFADSDEIRVFFGDETISLTPQRNLSSLVDYVAQRFSLCPATCKLMYQIDLHDDAEYLHFLEKGHKTLLLSHIEKKKPQVEEQSIIGASSNLTSFLSEDCFCENSKTKKENLPIPFNTTDILDCDLPSGKDLDITVDDLQMLVFDPAELIPTSLANSADSEADLKMAIASFERMELLTQRKEQMIEKLNESNAILESINKDSKELLDEQKLAPKPTTITLIKPPTSTYEACAILGVESPALAAFAPPLLRSERYSVKTSKKGSVPLALSAARKRATAAGAPGAALRLAHRDAHSTQKINYKAMLAEQADDMRMRQQSHKDYTSMLKKFTSSMPSFFQGPCASFVPVDEETKIKEKLARLIGWNTVAV